MDLITRYLPWLLSWVVWEPMEGGLKEKISPPGPAGILTLVPQGRGLNGGISPLLPTPSDGSCNPGGQGEGNEFSYTSSIRVNQLPSPL